MLREQLIPKIHNNMRDTFEQTINNLMIHNKSFVIWGAGSTGAEALKYINSCSNGKLVPKYIVDNNQSLWGTNRIVSPVDFFADKEQIDIVLVCVYVADQVINQLRENGYQGQIIPVSMSLFSIDEGLMQLYDKNMDNLERLYDILADERSRETIVAYLNVLRSGDIRLWDKVNGDSTVKLLDPEVLHFSHKEHFVDVGAFTGDTISKFLELCDCQYQSILGFEPDSHNFSAIQDYVTSCRLANTRILQVAAGNANRTTHFTDNLSESCTLSATGLEISMTTLDSISDAQNTTLLKISANGYDLGVIMGARNLIRRNKPQISAYANRHLLWQIPFYLKELVPEYEIYYRHYGIGRQAMICYAKLQGDNK